MPKNVELIQKQFGSNNALPSIELSDNALKLGGILANLYALKTDLNGEVEIMLSNIQAVIDELNTHKNDDVRHLTTAQINKINDAINQATALSIANSAINSAKPAIIQTAVQSAKTQSEDYTDAEITTLETTLKNYADNKDLALKGVLEAEIEEKIGNLNTPTIIDPETGEEVNEPLSEALQTSPNSIINAEYFYRFKNMIDNSSFEVFDGITKIPLGWDNGQVSNDASMFGTYSLKLTAGQTAKQTPSFQCDVSWLRGAYDTNDVIFCFYHKFGKVNVKIYDVVNNEYMNLTRLASDLSEIDTGETAEYGYEANWNRYRCMLKFTPKNSTRKIRVEFTAVAECYIDAPSMEPYEEGQFPSIYKDGRYSVSAYQILNPPPADVDRFTALEHFNIGNTETDTDGHIVYQELLKSDGSVGATRECSDFENGYPQTIIETFYKSTGAVNYVDTYSYTYGADGTVLSRTMTTTEGGV